MTMKPLRLIILMGVAGSGKTTVGKLLATRNGCEFYDADDYHPAENIAKMANGIPLDDTDRAPWLSRLRAEIIDTTSSGEVSVLACSALKRSYRELLRCGTTGVALVYLKGDEATLSKRLENRSGHYMKTGMLASQLAALEEPAADEGLTLGIASPPIEIVMAIEHALSLHISR